MTMMVGKCFALLLALTLTMLGLMALPATADEHEYESEEESWSYTEETEPDEDGFYSEITTEESPAPIPDELQEELLAEYGFAAAAQVKCKDVTKTERYRVIGVNVTLYTYTLVVNFCYDGSKVVGTPTTSRAGSGHAGWDFRGHLDLQKGPVNRWDYRVSTQGEFTTSVAPLLRRTPTIVIEVRRDGSSASQIVPT